MNIDLRCGNSLEVLKGFADNTFSSVVCDPPYGIQFMSKKWDYDVPTKELWGEVLRVLKPGGILLAFAGTRTQHRMAVNIEDAGFEIRDMISWIYGSGFPKNKNLGDGFGSSLKPAMEPITVARKPFKGSLENNWKVNGTGAYNIDGCRVPTDDNLNGGAYSENRQESGSDWVKNGGTIHSFTGKGYVQPEGRFPANILHDGSDEVVSLFPDSLGSGGSVPNVKITGYGDKSVGTGKSEYFGGERTKVDSGSGSAARFFYCAKTSKKDRGDGNNHPTVKPTDLMRYLCRLVTPPGGTVLDPFMGSGSTGKAAVLEGFNFVGIDLDPAYVEIAKARIEAVNK